MGALFPAGARRTSSEPKPLWACTPGARLSVSRLRAVDSFLLGRKTPLPPSSPGNGSSENLEGHLHLAHSSFLLSSTWRRHALLFLFCTRAPKVLSDPMTTLPAPFPWPLLLHGVLGLEGRRLRSFLGGREVGQPRAPALKDGARAAWNWSYLKRNHEKAGCFSERKGQ